jgi:hypothetical protein
LLNTLNPSLSDSSNRFHEFGSSNTLFPDIRNKTTGQVLINNAPGKILFLQQQQSKRMFGAIFNLWNFQQRWRLGTALQNGSNTKIDVKMDLGY